MTKFRTPPITREDFDRLMGSGGREVEVRIHGYLFRLEPKVERTRIAPEWRDFTETAYRDLLIEARERGYAAATFRNRPAGKSVIWRHDVDASMQRALRLARIDREEGITSTFFVNPHSALYNLLEAETLRIVRQIGELGHRFGLHFDSAARSIGAWSVDAVAPFIAVESRLLDEHVGIGLDAVSWHNPDAAQLGVDDDEIAGLVNAYGRQLRDTYAYVSDSNGYWRHRSISMALAEGHERLQILTHPEWWTPEPLPPRERIIRAVLGRAARVLEDYDDVLAKAGRANHSD